MGLVRESVPPQQDTEHPTRGERLSVIVPLLGSVSILLFLVLLGYTLVSRQGGGSTGFIVNTVGKAVPLKARPAPDFTLQLLDGTTFRLSEQRGQVVVVNYWASWCPPCRQETPVLERGWREYRDRGVVFIGVDILDTEKAALAFLQEFGVTYPNGRDATGEIAIDYGVTGIPETFFIDPEGRMVKLYRGPLSEEKLTILIEELLP